MLKFFITIIYLAIGIVAFGQEADANGDSLLNETDIPKNEEDYIIDTTIMQYTFNTNDDSIRNYGTPQDFPYMRSFDSALKAIGKIPADTIDLDGSSTASKSYRQKQYYPTTTFSVSPFLRVVLWIAAIFFLLFIIYQVFAKGNVFKSQSAKMPAAPSKEELPTNENEYDRLIAQSILNNNFRLAIRYLYLKTLYLLAASDLISLSIDKTNDQYTREMSKHHTYKDFIMLTSNYEYVWYGKFDVDKKLFEHVETNFRNYFKRL